MGQIPFLPQIWMIWAILGEWITQTRTEANRFHKSGPPTPMENPAVPVPPSSGRKKPTVLSVVRRGFRKLAILNV